MFNSVKCFFKSKKSDNVSFGVIESYIFCEVDERIDCEMLFQKTNLEDLESFKIIINLIIHCSFKNFTPHD